MELPTPSPNIRESAIKPTPSNNEGSREGAIQNIVPKNISPEKGESAINTNSEHSNTKDNKAKTKNPTKTEKTKINNTGNNTKQVNKQIKTNTKKNKNTKDTETKGEDINIKQVKNNMYY